ncbi:alternative oxidase [Marinobacterium sp. OS208]|nr:alternative oxidase [Marinobacterium sedimentorum]
MGYLEEEAVYSYTEYLADADSGIDANIPVPQDAVAYWQLPSNARLREVIIAVRADEAKHRDVNHQFSGQLGNART